MRVLEKVQCAGEVKRLNRNKRHLRRFNDNRDGDGNSTNPNHKIPHTLKRTFQDIRDGRKVKSPAEYMKEKQRLAKSGRKT